MIFKRQQTAGDSRVDGDLLLGTMLPSARALGWMVREGAGLGAQTDLRACWAHPMPSSISCSLFAAIRLFRSISYSEAIVVSLGSMGAKFLAGRISTNTGITANLSQTMKMAIKLHISSLG